MPDGFDGAATVQTGVEGTPVAGGAEPNAVSTTPISETPPATTAGQELNAQPQLDDRGEKAFAARLKQAQEKWERDNAPYLQTGRELEQSGYDLEAVRTQARQQDVNTLVQQGWDPQVAQQYVAQQQRAARAEQQAQDARIQADAARLAVKYGAGFNQDAVMAFARQRATETGEALSLETAYLVMNHENVRRSGEQAALAALQAGQLKGTESGTKGAGQKSIADLTDAEMDAINDRVRRGEKVKLW